MYAYLNCDTSMLCIINPHMSLRQLLKATQSTTCVATGDFLLLPTTELANDLCLYDNCRPHCRVAHQQELPLALRSLSDEALNTIVMTETAHHAT